MQNRLSFNLVFGIELVFSILNFFQIYFLFIGSVMVFFYGPYSLYIGGTLSPVTNCCSSISSNLSWRFPFVFNAKWNIYQQMLVWDLKMWDGPPPSFPFTLSDLCEIPRFPLNKPHLHVRSFVDKFVPPTQTKSLTPTFALFYFLKKITIQPT